jgi:hypothetical protein
MGTLSVVLVPCLRYSVDPDGIPVAEEDFSDTSAVLPRLIPVPSMRHFFCLMCRGGQTLSRSSLQISFATPGTQ